MAGLHGHYANADLSFGGERLLGADLECTGAVFRGSRARGRYHHFIKEPTAHFTGYGLKTAAEKISTLDFLKRIAEFVNAPTFDPAYSGDNSASDARKGIPAGYTYLFQLATHDLVDSSVDIIDLDGVGRAVTNLRREGLRLETLFGGGPSACPFAFHADAQRDDMHRLKVGPLRAPEGNLPRRQDLARLAFHDGEYGPDGYLNEVAVADLRNEDNAILAQLTTLFHRYHNAVLDRVAGHVGEAYEVGEGRGVIGRAVTTHIYRRIIRSDLMERLLHPTVYRHYSAAKSADFVDPPRDEFSVPREFAFAAVRLGHSMVRDRYKIHAASRRSLAQSLSSTSTRNPASLPLNDSWMVDWRLFFDCDPKNRPEDFNWARSFDLFSQSALMLSSLVARPGALAGVDRQFGLIFRDLIRNTAARLWSVVPLGKEIAARLPAGSRIRKLVETSLTADAVKRTVNAAIDRKTALVFEHSAKVLTGNDLAELAQNPPLTFYLLTEAWMMEDGRLGPLGSILIGEVFFRALESPAETQGELDWEHLVETIANAIHAGVGPLTEAPRSMPELLAALTAFESSDG